MVLGQMTTHMEKKISYILTSHNSQNLIPEKKAKILTSIQVLGENIRKPYTSHNIPKKMVKMTV